MMPAWHRVTLIKQQAQRQTRRQRPHTYITHPHRNTANKIIMPRVLIDQGVARVKESKQARKKTRDASRILDEDGYDDDDEGVKGHKEKNAQTDG